MRRRSLYFTGPRSVAVRDRPIPDPGPSDVRVNTLVSAVSPGTELLVYRDETPANLPVDETLPALDGEFEYPLRYGYAAVGEVSAVGSDVDSSWLGRTVFAFNPHESHFLTRPADLVPVPERCPPDRATLLATAETAATFALDARPLIGERVAIFGQGLVGLVTTRVLSSFPLGELITVDPLGDRRERSLDAGADATYDPTTMRERYHPVGPGETGTDAGKSGFDLTLELSGNPDALDDAISVTGYDGRVVVGSWYGTKPSRLSLGGRFHRSRIRIESSQVSTLDPARRGRWDRARRLSLAWSLLDGVDVSRLITHRVPIEDAAETYQRLDNSPDGAVGTLFTYQE